jgi:hypothetical protein
MILGCLNITDTWKTAVRHGDIECLINLHQNGMAWNEKICQYAAYCGHLNILKHANINVRPLDRGTLIYAISGGHVNCIRYFLENVEKDYGFNDECGRSWLCRYASENGRLDIVQLLYQNGYKLDNSFCRCTIRRGNFECFKYAFRKNHSSNITASDCLKLSKNIIFHDYLKFDIPCIKIQALVRGVLLRNRMGVHNPNTAVGQLFLRRMFYITLCAQLL